MQTFFLALENDFWNEDFTYISLDSIINNHRFIKQYVHFKIIHSRCDEFNNIILSMTHEPVFLKSIMTSEITGFRLGINGMSNDTIMLPCKL